MCPIATSPAERPDTIHRLLARTGRVQYPGAILTVLGAEAVLTLRQVEIRVMAAERIPLVALKLLARVLTGVWPLPDTHLFAVYVETCPVITADLDVPTAFTSLYTVASQWATTGHGGFRNLSIATDHCCRLAAVGEVEDVFLGLRKEDDRREKQLSSPAGNYPTLLQACTHALLPLPLLPHHHQHTYAYKTPNVYEKTHKLNLTSDSSLTRGLRNPRWQRRRTKGIRRMSFSPADGLWL